MLKIKTEAGGMAQVVEYLPSKHRDLSLNTSIAKGKRKGNTWHLNNEGQEWKTGHTKGRTLRTRKR
jgi:hypothetical protein